MRPKSRPTPVAVATILRERATVDVDGVAETWRLEWSEPTTPECATLEQFAMSCSCWGFAIAETGPLDLVRSRPNMPDERLALSPLFVGGKLAILQRWKLGEHEPPPENLSYQAMFRPAVTVMNLGDYDHDGRSTEFVLQIAASACYDAAVVVGISKSDPHLHVFRSAESPRTMVSLLHRDQWERLRTSSMIDVVQVPCGERGMGWADDGDGGMRCDLPDSALRIRADGEFHVTDTSRSCRGRMGRFRRRSRAGSDGNGRCRRR